MDGEAFVVSGFVEGDERGLRRSKHRGQAYAEIAKEIIETNLSAPFYNTGLERVLKPGELP
ncbi:MAG: hypothetical protein WB611_31115 [Stellaceae bacterium]